MRESPSPFVLSTTHRYVNCRRGKWPKLGLGETYDTSLTRTWPKEKFGMSNDRWRLQAKRDKDCDELLHSQSGVCRPRFRDEHPCYCRGQGSSHVESRDLHVQDSTVFSSEYFVMIFRVCFQVSEFNRNGWFEDVQLGDGFFVEWLSANLNWEIRSPFFPHPWRFEIGWLIRDCIEILLPNLCWGFIIIIVIICNYVTCKVGVFLISSKARKFSLLLI